LVLPLKEYSWIKHQLNVKIYIFDRYEKLM